MAARRHRLTRSPVKMRHPRAEKERDEQDSSDRITISRWRQGVRPERLQYASTATRQLRWSADLLELLIEELHVGEDLEQLIGVAVRELPRQRYPQAVAIALMLSTAGDPTLSGWRSVAGPVPESPAPETAMNSHP